MRERPVPTTPEQWQAIEDAIANWQPNDNHGRFDKGYSVGNEYIFEFLRALKAIPEFDFAALTPEDKDKIVAIWWGVNEETILKKDDEPKTLIQAKHLCDLTWPKVRYARGERLRTVVEKARTHQPPEADRFADDTDLRLLTSVCYHLQESCGDKPFHLSGKVAGDICGISQAWGANMLRILVKEGILVKVQEAMRGRATRYRYDWRDGRKQWGIGGPDPELTLKLIKEYTIFLRPRDPFDPNAKETQDFVAATQKMLKFAREWGVPKEVLPKLLVESYYKSFGSKGMTVFPANLCSKDAWDIVMPQAIRFAGLG